MNLTLAQLQRYVDQRYVDRGRGYFEQGLVVLNEVSDNRVQATCSGERVYKTTLTEQGGHLDGDCTCPTFEDFGPCKHIAATALAVMASRKGMYAASNEAVERADGYRAIREHLLEMEKSDLVDFVLRIADEEDVLWLLNEDE